ncbi:MAG: hypothetical protein JWM49_2144 [Microbacteriaceae bacterium]|jgi:hypothetical protein|nr:hypothetical protein [Microbacteriaceae bacterium]
MGSLGVWNTIGFVLLLASLFLLVSALFGIWRAKDRMEITHVLLWFLIVLFAPTVGPILWFVLAPTLHPGLRRHPKSR